MPRFAPTTALAAFVLIGLPGCPKKAVPEVPDVGPPPVVVVDAAPAEVIPDLPDAGDLDASDASKPRAAGAAVNPNVARLKQCCAALRNQQKQFANAPEFGWIPQAAIMCDTYANAFGAANTPPELAPLKAMFAGKSIPPLCQGL